MANSLPFVVCLHFFRSWFLKYQPAQQNLSVRIRELRVSPALDDIIVASEKSNDKLCHMVVSARAKCRVQIAQIAQTLNNTDQQK